MSKKILLLEDEPLISDDLIIVIENLGYQVVGVAETVVQAIELLSQQEIDLVLLDVQVKGDLDGVDLANIINEKFHVPFVFLTSFYDDDTLFRIRATNPAGYIVKPYKDADLKANISLAFNKQQFQQIVSDDLSLFVRKAGEMLKVNYHDINWIKGEDNYSDIYFNGEKSTVSQTLKSMEKQFEHYGFVRVHKSYVVNLSKISTINGTTLYIGLEAIPIGKAYRKQLFQKLTIL